ncbi:MAG: ribonuclease HI family protein [Thermoplasmata archaeon]|nr:MAG: ribonuclease HI family protein [Thermoplasmata archaeon]
MAYLLKFDGRCVPNPGEMGIGVVVLNEDNENIMEISEKYGDGTNNQAEYNALIKGLEELSKIYNGHLLVKGDSELVIKQISGEWGIKNKKLIPLYKRIKDLEAKFQHVDYEWIPATENKDADYLSAKVFGMSQKQREEKKVYLKPEHTTEFVFDSDSKIQTVRDEIHDRDVQRYYVKSVLIDGKRERGNHFETGSKKLIVLLDYYKPLEDKKIRIIPTKTQQYTDYMVELLEE